MRAQLKAAPPKLEQAVTSLDRIVRDVRVIEAVMRNLRSLFTRQPIMMTPYNMVELVRDGVGLIKEDVNRRSIPLEYEYENPVVMALADRLQIQQIIINLIGSAIEAMEGTERLPLLRIWTGQTEDGQVLTEFIDNGCGLPVRLVGSIFDAFVTTKKNGMGIGLSISRSIAEAHGGQLWAESNGPWSKIESLIACARPVA